MSSFTKPIQLALTEKECNGRVIFSIEEEFEFRFWGDNGSYTVFVPKNFHTDFASIPKIFHSFLNPLDPRWAKAAVVHDYLYRIGRYQTKWKKFLDWHFCSREEADEIFLHALLTNEKNPTPKWLASCFFWAVRIFGAKNFRRSFSFDQ